MVVAGCSSQGQNSASPRTIEAGQHTPAQVRQMEKYQTPVTVTLGLQNDSTITFPKGQNFDKNDIYSLYAQQMGIHLKNEWIVSSNTYPDKVNLSVASGGIPDLFFVPTEEQVKQLVDAGLVQDLTPYFQNDLSAQASTYFTQKEQTASATFNGKIMAIPFTNTPYNSLNFIYVRKDWLKKLGLPEPRTMNDVYKISAAFAKDNPGGAKTTYGLAVTKNLNDSALGLQGVFNGYHAYPEIWVKNAQGKLVYGSVQTQMEPALAGLQKMYKAGEIDPEFAVKDSSAEAQLIANNQLGMAYGMFWLPSFPLMQAILKNNKITQDWAAFPIPSVDNQPAKSEVPVGVNGYYVVSKKCKNPDAVFELLNKWAQVQPGNVKSLLEYTNGKTTAEQNYWKLNPFNFVPPTLTDPRPVIEAITNHNSSILKNPNDQQIFQLCEQYLHGNGSDWNTWAKEGQGGTHLLQYQVQQNGNYQMDAFYGPPTPTMVKQWANLESLLSQGFMQIVTGKQPVSYYDTLVRQWNELGGQQISQEVNSWHAHAAIK